MAANIITTELEGLGNILKSKNLHVPKFQRSFSWEPINVHALYEDIQSAIESKEPEYFLGSIVVSVSSSNNIELIDGQQRLATVSILLSVMRNFLRNCNDDDRAKLIEQEYLFKKDFSTLGILPRLHLNEEDHNFYERFILNNEDIDLQQIKKQSHILLKTAKEEAELFLNQHIKIFSKNKTQAISELVEFIEKYAKVILVSVPDESNAFTVFETLNDRGMQLSSIDLLKNYLYGLSGQRVQFTQNNWTNMMSIIESAESTLKPIDFIRHCWIARNGVVREKDLYQNIKRKIVKLSDVTKLSVQLCDDAEKYIALIDSSSDFWSSFPDETRDNIQAINLLQTKQIRPLLLAILQKFDTVEASKALKIAVAISVRLLVQSKLGSGVVETHFCNCAKEIFCGNIKTLKNLIEALRQLIPNDAEFFEDFKTARSSKPLLARFLLRSLERTLRTKELGDEELIPNQSKEIVTLEHIFPKNPHRDWMQEDDVDALMANVTRLGNLTLLSCSKNKNLKSIPFSERINVYQASQFLLTKQIAETYSRWTLESLENRQEFLAKLALETWPFSAS